MRIVQYWKAPSERIIRGLLGQPGSEIFKICPGDWFRGLHRCWWRMLVTDWDVTNILFCHQHLKIVTIIT